MRAGNVEDEGAGASARRLVRDLRAYLSTSSEEQRQQLLQGGLCVAALSGLNGGGDMVATSSGGLHLDAAAPLQLIHESCALLTLTAFQHCNKDRKQATQQLQRAGTLLAYAHGVLRQGSPALQGALPEHLEVRCIVASTGGPAPPAGELPSALPLQPAGFRAVSARLQHLRLLGDRLVG
ncbi:hypothetical protein HYH03_013327 [Edaphochlamys debaryana]|uniref:Uncharacterized protein n=1 Tax=Edaphochlamys debaryana TaxID=47281 RepID=A0A836BT50_9CHLO|nr:hypothetical protein HYH03_013327 [Edaphochlamys debaryana]|eukprot:KAG2488186.1 hypothetical protein HYH03_013327 [Edaphochlamys debaryana]